MSEEVKNLIAKIAEACDAVGGVEKKGTNTTQNYKYVKAADVAKAIRHELFSRGVIVLQDEQPPEYVEVQTKTGATMCECRMAIEFTLTDGKERENITGYGVARDSGDKAIYKAKTGALKYFLRGLGLIPDEKDDPEYDGKAKSAPEEEEEQVPTIKLPGIILEEKEAEHYFWYKLKALTNDGEAEVYVKSLKKTDTGRLADKVGHGVELEVTESGKGGVYQLVRIMAIGKPATLQVPSDAPAEAEPVKPHTPVEQSLRAPQGAKKPPWRKATAAEITIHNLQRQCGVPDGAYRAILESVGAKHAYEVRSGADFDRVILALRGWSEGAAQ